MTHWKLVEKEDKEESSHYLADSIYGEIVQERRPNVKWLDQFDSYHRIAEWYSASWTVRAVASLHRNGRIEGVKSPGTRGLRKDSPKEFWDAVFEREKEILKNILRLMGAEELPQSKVSCPEEGDAP